MVAAARNKKPSPVAEELGQMLRDCRPSLPRLEEESPTAVEWVRFFELARPARRRTMREFAEQEIIIPDGPYKGERFSVETQPFTRLWLDEVDSGRWPRFNSTGPRQTGKTLLCFIIPILYYLFEVVCAVICLTPNMQISWEKWTLDLEPVIKKTRYAHLLPTTGAGSKGGKVEMIKLLNGAVLKFMTAGGSGKRRVGFTAPVLVITETDDMDEAGGGSREADKITQAEHCCDTYAKDGTRRIFAECTLTTKEGRTWRDHEDSTHSRIVLQCPHCRLWVSPERDHITGWEDADDIITAQERAHWFCPDCATAWSEDDRIAANRSAKLLHDGQEIDEDGNISGDPPRTDRFGFRWSAVNNNFWDDDEVAARLWRAKRADDEENAERELCQFVFATPYEPPASETTPLLVEHITKRTTNEPRGLVPAGIQQLGLGIDVHLRHCEWALLGFRSSAAPHVIDYGVIDVHSRDSSFELAIQMALQNFAEEFIEPGWPVAGQPPGNNRVPEAVFIDARYQGEDAGSFPVYAVCNTLGDRYMPCLGFGIGQDIGRGYTAPKKIDNSIRRIGEGYDIRRLKSPKITVCYINANHWKSWLRARLQTGMGNPGAMTLFNALPAQHISYARHLTAEEPQDDYSTRGERRIIWVNPYRRANHWLDATALGCVAGHYAGARLVIVPPPQAAASVPLGELMRAGKSRRRHR